MIEPKPGAKTSEFAVTLIWSALTAGVAFGFVPEQTDVQHATTQIASALGALMVSVSYITGRNQLKGGKASADDALEAIKKLAGLVDELRGERGRRSGERTGAKE